MKSIYKAILLSALITSNYNTSFSMDPTGGGFSKKPPQRRQHVYDGAGLPEKGGLGRSKQHTSFDSDEDSQQALQSGYGFRGYPQQQPPSTAAAAAAAAASAAAAAADAAARGTSSAYRSHGYGHSLPLPSPSSSMNFGHTPWESNPPENTLPYFIQNSAARVFWDYFESISSNDRKDLLENPDFHTWRDLAQQAKQPTPWDQSIPQSALDVVAVLHGAKRSFLSEIDSEHKTPQMQKFYDYAMDLENVILKAFSGCWGIASRPATHDEHGQMVSILGFIGYSYTRGHSSKTDGTDFANQMLRFFNQYNPQNNERLRNHHMALYAHVISEYIDHSSHPDDHLINHGLDYFKTKGHTTVLERMFAQQGFYPSGKLITIRDFVETSFMKGCPPHPDYLLGVQEQIDSRATQLNEGLTAFSLSDPKTHENEDFFRDLLDIFRRQPSLNFDHDHIDRTLFTGIFPQTVDEKGKTFLRQVFGKLFGSEARMRMFSAVDSSRNNEAWKKANNDDMQDTEEPFTSRNYEIHEYNEQVYVILEKYLSELGLGINTMTKCIEELLYLENKRYIYPEILFSFLLDYNVPNALQD